MLLFAPIGLGAIIGIIFIAITHYLKKNQSSYAKIPSYLAALSAVVIFIISFQVRGFEGAAYGILAVTILIFSIIAFVVSLTSKKNHDLSS